jgi:N-acetylneuraminate synthase
MSEITIIAELGINHNGSLDIAKALIDMAKGCGCDLVKFQKRTIDIVYSKEFLDSPRKSPWGINTRQQKKGLEFNKEQYDEIDKYSKELNIPWFASAWDIKSLEFLDRYNCPHQKVASAMATHIEFLKAIAERKKHTFISTGMCTMKMIEEAVDIFARRGCKYTLMHSTSVYPCPDEDTNIGMVRKLIERFGEPVGYSGHEVGLLPSIVAVVLGATAIERHITLDRAMYGSDQPASVEKRGLELLVKECRGVQVTLGDGRKSIKEIEQGIAKKLRYWEENE